MLRVVTEAVATSPSTAQDLGVVARIIPPGVEEALVHARVPAEPDLHELISVGSLIPRKDHRLLLAALARLQRLPGPAFRMRIFGGDRDPREAATLRALARGLPVSFEGEQADLGPAYA